MKIDNSHDKFFKEIKQISNKGGEIAMTTAVKLEQRGLQKGLQKGILEGKKEAIVNLYENAKLPVKKIAEYLKLDIRFVTSTLKEKGLF